MRICNSQLVPVFSGIADQVIQPQDLISVLTGESLKLECQVASGLSPGPVKWFLGNGPNRKLIYADKTHKESERVTRHEESSDTDFTIILHNVTLKDAGTYYCVKQKKETGGDKDWKSGHGTEVVVKGERRK
ncbi:tyrosine-protein phosphatase non-receptor type substrate 1-like [Sceloporus undulatus]|uniref:tyrosine-protein phosphatase non-receptor type substrate 1-like n=1 Tax=Sceloporus undulatus TaxID=8520 RepID=UPI001C4CAD62|nr:tyrosine-protein phosphatase non-receptor type substrate 1-like [Sceloporus undulatus]